MVQKLSGLALRNAAGDFNIADTITKPVTAHRTTVSQKTPVIDTKACLMVEVVLEEMALIGRDPIPASFVNNPREMPTLIVQMIDCPVIPPVKALGWNAVCRIYRRLSSM